MNKSILKKIFLVENDKKYLDVCIWKQQSYYSSKSRFVLQLHRKRLSSRSTQALLLNKSMFWGRNSHIWAVCPIHIWCRNDNVSTWKWDKYQGSQTLFIKKYLCPTKLGQEFPKSAGNSIAIVELKTSEPIPLDTFDCVNQQCTFLLRRKVATGKVLEVEWATVQQCSSAAVQQFSSSAVQQFSSSAVQQFSSSAVQQFSSSAVQQFSSAA